MTPTIATAQLAMSAAREALAAAERETARTNGALTYSMCQSAAARTAALAANVAAWEARFAAADAYSAAIAAYRAAVERAV